MGVDNLVVVEEKCTLHRESPGYACGLPCGSVVDILRVKIMRASDEKEEKDRQRDRQRDRKLTSLAEVAGITDGTSALVLSHTGTAVMTRRSTASCIKHRIDRTEAVSGRHLLTA